jgi:hypothetical protein
VALADCSRVRTFRPTLKNEEHILPPQHLSRYWGCHVEPSCHTRAHEHDANLYSHSGQGTAARHVPACPDARWGTVPSRVPVSINKFPHKKFRVELGVKAFGCTP